MPKFDPSAREGLSQLQKIEKHLIDSPSLTPTDSADNVFVQSGNVVPLVLRAAASSSADLLQIQDSNGSVLSSVGRNGFSSGGGLSAPFFISDVTQVQGFAASTPVQLTVPTTSPVDANHEVTHPSVVQLQKPVGGYYYWMAITPYQGGGSAVENPSIFSSNDGITWVEPAGISNPIVARPAPGFNSDPKLLYLDSKFYLFFRSSSTGDNLDKISLMTSTDGVTWTTPQIVLSATSATEQLVSPAIVRDSTGLWRMWSINISANPNTYVYRSTSDPTSWPASGTVTDMVAPAGGSARDLWHQDVVELGDDTYMCILADTASGSQAGGCEIFLTTSTNGVNWKTYGRPILRLNSFGNQYWYKTAGLLQNGDQGPILRLWAPGVSTAGLWNLHYVEVPLSAHASETTTVHGLYNTYLLTTLLAKNKIPPYTACDTFDRADNAAAVGTSDTSHLWTTATGTHGILGGMFYSPAATVAISTIDPGHADGRIEMMCPVVDNTSGHIGRIVFRFTDTNNYWWMGYQFNTFQIGKVVASVATTVNANLGSRVQQGDILAIEINGNTITGFQNGTTMGSFTDSALAGATKCGIYTATSVGRFDNFTVRKLS